MRWIRWRLRMEICPKSCSIFKRCFRTQANRCKTPKRNWASYKQIVPKWLREFVHREQNDIEVLLRRALPQPDETLSQQMEAVVRAAAAFRTKFSAPSAAEPMHQDLQEAQEEDGCRRRLRTRSQRSRRSRSR